MTIDETKLIMAIVKAAYPDFYKNAGYKEKVSALMLWCAKLSSYTYKQCHDAVKKLIAESPFVPKISDIIQRIEPTKALVTAGAPKGDRLSEWYENHKKKLHSEGKLTAVDFKQKQMVRAKELGKQLNEVDWESEGLSYKDYFKQFENVTTKTVA